MADRAIHTRRIDERIIPGRRLGRHVRHDPRSLAYLVEESDPAGWVTVRHHRHVPVLDQADLGACTGFAAEGCVGTGDLYTAIPATVAARPSETDARRDADQARGLYSVATGQDDYPGSWPPDDTGSSGLAVAKACKAAGVISGYRHATSLNAALTALTRQAVIAGINWYSSFDDPNPGGRIRIEPDAYVRGGHEICVDEIDAERALVGFTNSWGPSWGAAGRAYLTWTDFGRLLHEDGDVTVFTPISEPPPAPSPTGTLAELAAMVEAWLRALQDWMRRHRIAGI